MKRLTTGLLLLATLFVLSACGGGSDAAQRAACLRVKDYDLDFAAEGRGRPPLLSEESINRLGTDLRRIERAAFRTSDSRLQKMARQARREWADYAFGVASSEPEFVAPSPVWSVSEDVLESKAALVQYCDKTTGFNP